ncbi:uncharacterized protein N7459_000218 [Penicillium hispanicum]|uniref:uncharacterized protein n=1 Tax=Penicillium hispanicum TaxID=1080232 RepID=UPI00254037FE|nr:uncharacterized protein N7459_000218 [Penicillium hispanicum]KAJ5594010.1 hypothetical protein N7459_000218 [Penicillium hispanicum]
MTIAVLAAPTTRNQRREPLGTIGMAASQAQSRSATASGRAGRGRGGGRSTRLSASQQGLEEATNNDGKRKADYEEDAEGFQFSRVPPKKKKPSVEPVAEVPPSDVENAPPKSTPRRGRPPKKRTAEDANLAEAPAKVITTELPTRKSTRGAAKDPEPKPHPANATRSSRNYAPSEEVSSTPKGKRGRPARPRVSGTNGFKSPEQPPAGTKVALPVADTPVIQRNKELRGAKSDKGRRRSSLGMRGRRASSLIDSGASNALPHREVGTADFYKHIADEGLPEPRRMRQLLIWCGTRALGDKPSGSHSEEQSARLAALVIQEELLKDFSSNSELSNWFSREDVNPPTVVVKKPNPRNVQNTDKIKELEEQIQRLQKERHALNALFRQPAIPRVDATGPDPSTDPSKLKRRPTKSSNEQIDSSLLDPSQQAIFASLDPSSTKPAPEGESSTSSAPRPPMPPSAVSSRLSRVAANLAPTLDAFAAGVHDIELYRASADAVSSRILSTCAQRLEERDMRNTQQRLAIEGSDNERSPELLPQRPREDLGVILGALSRVERR